MLTRSLFGFKLIVGVLCDMRFFNTSGPVKRTKHYALPPLSRFDLTEILTLIEQEKYFVLHAPRQSGKTSCLLALMEDLNQKYHCVYINLEIIQAKPEDVYRDIRTIVDEIVYSALNYLRDGYPESVARELKTHLNEERMLGELLSRWSAHNTKPLVLLMDEIDSLNSDTLIAVLRQLRSGYPRRPRLFPQSIILCGVRDVRQYRIYSSQEKIFITGGSVFNFKSDSLRLDDFTQDQIAELYRQHTEETGQIFIEDAVSRVWELTHGQPWLVNALAYEACFILPSGKDRRQPITVEHIEQAKNRLLRIRRKPHFDHLTDKLWHEEARRVIEPLLLGAELAMGLRVDTDIIYMQDLGLIRQTENGSMEIANPVYRELICRWLTWPLQSGMSHTAARYMGTKGRLDTATLLADFQKFFREHFAHWITSIRYQQAGPLLMLQAFLRRVVEGKGDIEQEFGQGRGQLDLLVTWASETGPQKIVITLAIAHGEPETWLMTRLNQTLAYLIHCRAEEGHLVIFDRTPDKSWQEKQFRRQATANGRTLTLWGT